MARLGEWPFSMDYPRESIEKGYTIRNFVNGKYFL